MHRLWLSVALLLAVLAPARADGPPAPPPAPPATPVAPVAPVPSPEVKARTKALQDRADTWWTQRKKLIGACFQCSGQGMVRAGRRIVTCPKCDGRKRLVPAAVYRRLFYEMKSPAFRLQEGVQDRVETAYLVANGSEWPKDINRFKILRVEFADPTHGAVYVTENDDTTPRPQRWLFAEEAPGKGTWWLYDEAADGAWPGSPGGPTAALEGSPLEPAEYQALADALSGVTMQHTLGGAAGSGKTLLVTLSVKPVPGGTDLGTVSAGDLRLTGKALFASLARWDAIQWTLRAKYRDRFGTVDEMPYLVATITRADFGKIVWSNLQPSEWLALFGPQWPPHEGWVIWNQE